MERDRVFPSLLFGEGLSLPAQEWDKAPPRWWAAGLDVDFTLGKVPGRFPPAAPALRERRSRAGPDPDPDPPSARSFPLPAPPRGALGGKQQRLFIPSLGKQLN